MKMTQTECIGHLSYCLHHGCVVPSFSNSGKIDGIMVESLDSGVSLSRSNSCVTFKTFLNFIKLQFLQLYPYNIAPIS